MTAVILFIAFSLVLLLCYLWGIHDCKKVYGIPRGVSPDEIKWVLSFTAGEVE